MLFLLMPKRWKFAGVTRHTKDPEGGEILRDHEGNPIGIFIENAVGLIARHRPNLTLEQRRRALDASIGECLKNGLTSFHDASSTNADIALYKEFLKEGKLKIRLYVMLAGWENGDLLEEWYARGPEIGLGDNFLTIRAIKLAADGALGNRGAWLLEPYSDRPDHVGHEVMPMNQIYKIAKDGLANGFQVCVHAIGDRANREVLNQFEKALQEASWPEDHRFRIQHAQHINSRDIPRFANLGVIASVQGIHMISDIPWAIERLGPTRIADGAYVWQKLLQSGAKVINGTDNGVDIIASFYALTTRKTLDGRQEDWFHPEQKMSREQALNSYTLDAAYGAFEENIKGSIEVGKLADFTVFSQDIMKVPDDEFLNTKVEYTIINRKILYNREP